MAPVSAMAFCDSGRDISGAGGAGVERLLEGHDDYALCLAGRVLGLLLQARILRTSMSSGALGRRIDCLPRAVRSKRTMRLCAIISIVTI